MELPERIFKEMNNTVATTLEKETFGGHTRKYTATFTTEDRAHLVCSGE